MISALGAALLSFQSLPAPLDPQFGAIVTGPGFIANFEQLPTALLHSAAANDGALYVFKEQRTEALIGFGFRPGDR
jgi:hypothetical protein